MLPWFLFFVASFKSCYINGCRLFGWLHLFVVPMIWEALRKIVLHVGVTFHSVRHGDSSVLVLNLIQFSEWIVFQNHFKFTLRLIVEKCCKYVWVYTFATWRIHKQLDTIDRLIQDGGSATPTARTQLPHRKTLYHSQQMGNK